MRRPICLLLAAALAVLSAGGAAALEVRVGVIRVDRPQLAPISRLEEWPRDLGFAGGRLADEDNATTGRFLGHTYVTETAAVPPDTAEAALDRMLGEGLRLFVVLGQGDDVLALADRAGDGALLLNAGARETRLRDADCRANLLHVAPSEAMLADAVAEFAIWKKWTRWALISGSHPEDRAMAEAYRRAAAIFGAKIVEERVFEDTGGSRRTDTGHVLVQRQIPVFSEGMKDHDLVIAADASDVFAPYLPFHMWDPRPVMGAAGLRPVSFHAATEAWGATQFQRRFEALTGRQVREEDYQVWLALRVLGEAVTRTDTADPAELRAYMLGPEFELAAFKGQKVTFRDWNGQLRQPLLLYDGRINVSVSPQDGFLHQRSPLDTLGLDAPESSCAAFR
ncbi:ABC transporter substrate-binding protein [Rhodovulum visakhapatnamense]|uniref:Amino acid/amide ABC transporter substrate-binding protein (HAAT family) n=1 Tax=Rhodovulum visakhapatnamense TaxID=364297 RepID=A0A4R8FZL7_9RHOB|nr:ABC transporter substrate-binding protein [Rhodovulum visakhapatnamense]TDX29743.1 amino acid/amide ABC transporter substrate-binding protein (HAAT family) [Rhodovulum visakhapatnamense]